MKDVLQEIIENKRLEVAAARLERPIEQVIEAAAKINEKGLYEYPFAKSLAKSKSGIIAEFKRRSPSKGWIAEQADPLKIVPAYEKAGASAISILTDTKYFGGSTEDIIRIREQVKTPILRKEFIVDEYQIYEARAIGANAILLIASALSIDECARFTSLAHELKMDVLLELHHEAELAHCETDADLIGINNRNLGTFKTSVDNSIRLFERLPKDRLLVSESGIHSPKTVRMLRDLGYQGFLVGEAFMKTANAGAELAKFVQEIEK